MKKMILIMASLFVGQFALAQTSPSTTDVSREAGGDVRAPSPKLLNENRQDYFQVGAGPAYGAGLSSDSLMYNIVGSYNWNMNERWVAKAIGDLYMGSGSVSSRFVNIGGGADFYIPEATVMKAVPYVSADAGLGLVRNAVEETRTGVAVGAGGGFKFNASNLNMDINAHYTLLTAQIGATNPSVFGVRVAVNF